MYCQMYKWNQESYGYRDEDQGKLTFVARLLLFIYLFALPKIKILFFEMYSYFPVVDCFNVDEYINVHLIWFY